MTVYAATCATTAGREWNSAAQTSQDRAIVTPTPTSAISSGRGIRERG